MLILTRRVGEALTIGNCTEVRILGVRDNQVRIGVDAPREISVHREEIYNRIKRNAREAQSDQGHVATPVRHKRRRHPSLS